MKITEPPPRSIWAIIISSAPAVCKLVDISKLSEQTVREEYSRLNKSYEFHIDFALKVVGFFYATVGFILSIYFGNNSTLNNAVIVLLIIPIIMSIILGKYFVHGASLWRDQADYMYRLSAKLSINEPTRVKVLARLLKIFGILFFMTAIILVGLLTGVIINLLRVYKS